MGTFRLGENCLQQNDNEPVLDMCPLCASIKVVSYYEDKTRPYLCCRECQLVFVPRAFHLSSTDEQAVYDQHQNNPNDQGYRRFLSRLADPLLEKLAPNSLGLDFGSGPGPTLSVMLEEKGHKVNIYDPFYAPDKQALAGHYDFITSTEVIEHLAAPGEELDRLWGLLKHGGYLGLMTKQVTNQKSFDSWHYKNDPTHISFFSQQTFEYLGAKWGSAPVFIGADVILFRK
ncbi:MAG: class I SAM-dependent methyltransferase [Porticoccaceae bacterium]|nr:class I SAM-dependent methyltransferase [Porticoccaceae bacterium]